MGDVVPWTPIQHGDGPALVWGRPIVLLYRVERVCMAAHLLLLPRTLLC